MESLLFLDVCKITLPAERRNQAEDSRERVEARTDTALRDTPLERDRRDEGGDRKAALQGTCHLPIEGREIGRRPKGVRKVEDLGEK